MSKKFMFFRLLRFARRGAAPLLRFQKPSQPPKMIFTISVPKRIPTKFFYQFWKVPRWLPHPALQQFYPKKLISVEFDLEVGQRPSEFRDTCFIFFTILDVYKKRNLISYQQNGSKLTVVLPDHLLHTFTDVGFDYQVQKVPSNNTINFLLYLDSISSVSDQGEMGEVPPFSFF
jgi:hypothetical protein